MPSLELESLRRAYSGRTVFLTGHTGFKGSWLALALNELGAKVHGFALPAVDDSDIFHACGVKDLVHHQIGDIRNLEDLTAAVAHAQPDVIFHLAAQALVRRSYQAPAETFQTNVGGSVNLLETVRMTASVRALVYVTSDKCYRNKEWTWGYREIDELGGDDPYSASKAAAEMVFASYVSSFFRQRPGFGAASVRAGNVIGGGDWNQNRIVPDCIRALRAGQPIVLRNPLSTRPWQHVLEPVFGYLLVGARLLEAPGPTSGSYNFGPRAEDTRTVRDLAHSLVSHWGSGQLQERPDPNPMHEAGLLQLNCEKARQQLGWQAVWGFDKTTQATVQWYRHAQDPGEILAFTRSQIRSYLEDAR